MDELILLLLSTVLYAQCFSMIFLKALLLNSRPLGGSETICKHSDGMITL